MRNLIHFLAGFLRDPGPNGKPSMTRLAIGGLLACTIALVTLICWYVVTRPAPDPLVIGAIVGGVAALVANGIIALRNRSVTGETQAGVLPSTLHTPDPSPSSHGGLDAHV